MNYIGRNNGLIFRGSKQQGVITIMLALSLAVVLGIVGLAIDFGHAYVNKTRLQNLADALVLSGAKKLDETSDTTQANSAISTLFNLNIAGAGNQELQNNLSFSNVTVAFSDHLYPFVAGGANPKYVRVTIDSLDLQSWFTRALGLDEIPIQATAVAGPSSSLSPIVCDAAPLMVCGDSSDNPANNGGATFWGYTPGNIQILKTTSKKKLLCNGPGNFQLVRLAGGNGASVIREALAGNQDECTDLTLGIETKPGNTVGPTIQGLNTRFGEYLGPMSGRQDEFPPDVVTTGMTTSVQFNNNQCVGGVSADVDFSWEDYKQAVSNENYDNPPPIGVFNRRILRVPIGDCDNASGNGSNKTIPYLGVGCFFILKKVEGNSKDGNIYGEFVEGCTLDGVVGEAPDDSGPYKIVLYENPG